VVAGEADRVDLQAEQATLTVPRLVFAPVVGLRWMMSCASRRLYMMVPSGRVTRPHGMSLSVVTVVTVQTGLLQLLPVFTEISLLRGETLPALSRATT
jgi:hypothetical protein